VEERRDIGQLTNSVGDRREKKILRNKLVHQVFGQPGFLLYLSITNIQWKFLRKLEDKELVFVALYMALSYASRRVTVIS
jgi:hypothetical protein